MRNGISWMAAALLLVGGCTTSPRNQHTTHVAMPHRVDTLEQALRLATGGKAAIARVPDGLLVTIAWSAIFRPNSYDYSAAGAVLLDGVGAALANGRERLLVTGLSDNSGNAVINRPQSLNRAVVVANRLMASGVSPGRITTVGLGSARPLASNAIAAGRQHNRRIELLVQIAH